MYLFWNHGVSACSLGRSYCWPSLYSYLDYSIFFGITSRSLNLSTLPSLFHSSSETLRFCFSDSFFFTSIVAFDYCSEEKGFWFEEKGFFMDYVFFWDWNWLSLWLTLGKSSNPNCILSKESFFIDWFLSLDLLKEFSKKFSLSLTGTYCFLKLFDWKKSKLFSCFSGLIYFGAKKSECSNDLF